MRTLFHSRMHVIESIDQDGSSFAHRVSPTHEGLRYCGPFAVPHPLEPGTANHDLLQALFMGPKKGRASFPRASRRAP